MNSSEPSSAKPGMFARLKAGLSRSSASLSSGLGGLFTKKRLDAETIAELEEALIDHIWRAYLSAWRASFLLDVPHQRGANQPS